MTQTTTTAGRRQRRRTRRVQARCAECGATFKTFAPSLAKFCSTTCRSTAHERRQREAAGTFASHAANDD